MLFKEISGKYIIINKYDFKSDKEYYEKILEIKGLNISKVEDPINDILNIIQKKNEYMTYKPNKNSVTEIR
tara:strand:+ start:3295 stop:3507 length:213 start_codon:yes stop_codon:yes gene_type:complete